MQRGRVVTSERDARVRAYEKKIGVRFDLRTFNPLPKPVERPPARGRSSTPVPARTKTPERWPEPQTKRDHDCSTAVQTRTTSQERLPESQITSERCRESQTTPERCPDAPTTDERDYHQCFQSWWPQSSGSHGGHAHAHPFPCMLQQPATQPPYSQWAQQASPKRYYGHSKTNNNPYRREGWASRRSKYGESPNKGGGSNCETGVNRVWNAKKKAKKETKARAQGLPTRAEERAS